MFKKTTHILLVATLAFGAIVGGFFMSTKDYEKVHAATCGDGILETGEECDDDNTTSGDGCSSSCAIESGYSCVGEPSSCQLSSGVPTSAGVGNLSPEFTVTTSDGGSDTSNPTNVGSDITFTATATDVNTDQYYLLLCDDWGGYSPGNNDVPTCIDTSSWGVSSATNSGSQATVTYTTQGTDSESNQWFAYVCDKLPTTSGPACSLVAGDQGSALGTITFSGIPADGDNITVDSITYEFDTNASYTNTQVDISSALSLADVTAALVSAEIGSSSTMIARGTVVIVRANTAGSGGNSIGMTENLDTNGYIALSGATLTGGSDSNASPFQVNHAPTFGTVTVTDTSGGEINPGDNLRFTLPNAQIDDTDTSGGQDLISMYICTDATTAFNYSTNSCTGGSLVCSHTSVNPTTSDATCDETGNTLVPSTDTNGTENFKVYVEDEHDFAGTGTNQQTYTISNSAPTHDTPELDIHAPTLPNSVGYWQFEDGDGATSFDDETSNENNGTCTNCPDWTAEGYSGGAYDFDGISNIIGIPDSSSLHFNGGSFTFSAWIRPESLSVPNAPEIFSKRISSESQIHLRIGYQDEIEMQVAGTGGLMEVNSANSVITENTWYYVVGVYDPNGSSQIYINGNASGTPVSSNIGNFDNTASAIIGKGFNSWEFNGLIDEPHIYNRALTADEIADIYNAYTTPGTSAYTDSNMDFSCKAINIADHDSDTTTTIFNWEKDGTSTTVLNMPFDSNVTSTATDAVVDYSGNENHGTLQGASPTWTSSGIKGGAYTFNRSDDHIGVTGLNSNISTEATFAMWIKHTGDTATRTIYSYGTANDWFDVRLNSTTNILSLWDDPDNDNVNLSTAYVITPNVWHYIVMTVKTSGSKEFFVDGVSVFEGSGSGKNMSAIATDSFDIGARNDEGYLFDGDIDEVRVYNSALSAEQIAQNYNNGIPNYNTIVNQEIEEGDNSWQCKVTVNDAQSINPDSVTNTSNTIDPSNSEPVQNFPSARAHALVDSNSVGYWQFEDGDINSNILDETTNNNDASCTNCPTWTAEGAIGGGYEFDGVNDKIIIPNDSTLNMGTSDFTISTWMKRNAISGADEFVLDKKQANSNNNGYYLALLTDDTLSIKIANGTTFASESSATGITDTAWHHVVAVVDRDTGITFYIDGVGEDGTRGDITTGSAWNIDSTFYLTLGTYYGNVTPSAYFFNGLMDEVHIYDRTLNATEIKNLYNSQSYVYSTYDLGASARGLSDSDSDVAYATLDWMRNDTSMAVLNMSFNKNITATTAGAVTDYSSYGNHGTLGGGTADYAPTWTNAATCGNNSGGCYSFDGSNDFIRVADASSLEPTTAITVEAWAYPNNITTNQYYEILRKEDGGTRILFAFQEYGTILSWGINTAGSYAELDVPISSTNYVNQWVHLVATYDGTTKRVYRNGVEIGNATSVGALSVGGSADLCIGCHNFSVEYFNGKIDEFRMYNRALSSSEISSIYNAGKPNYQNLAYGELVVGESWKATVTPADALGNEGTTLTSNAVEILGFSTDVSDGGSSDTTPTNAGSNVTFTGTFNTDGSDYYLAICKSDSVTAGNDTAPTCDGGAWAISSSIVDGASSSTATTPATYTTSSSDSEQNTWYAFACTKETGGGICSSSTQGTGNTGSPFVVNHQPAFTNNVGVTDTVDSVDTAPGEQLKFTFAISDSNADGMTAVVCDIDGFNDLTQTCITEEICRTTVAGGSTSATCTETDSDPNDTDTNPVLIGIPEPHGSTDFTIHLFDEHSFTDDGTYENQNVGVTDVAPYVSNAVDYTTNSPVTLTAGISTNYNFTVTVKDDNGDTDITGVGGILYDSDETELTSGICTDDENDCYTNSSCTLSNNTSGTDNEATAVCYFSLWFNANAGTNWLAHVNPTDGTTVTDETDSTAITIGALAGIDIINTSIAYGSIMIGSSSDTKTISLRNAGNQTNDFLLEGTDMCTDYPTCSGDIIPRANQKWHIGDSVFNWSDPATGDGPFPLVETPSTVSGTTGCVNHDLRKRADHTSDNETNLDAYWKLRIPSGTPAGTYNGEVTFTTTNQCTAEICNNSTDDDGDGRIDCSDHHDCDFYPSCTVATIPMRLTDQSRKDELLVDGNMEAVGTSAWTVWASALITKETTNPYAGAQVLRVTYNGEDNPGALQSIATTGKEYRITGWFRGDGTIAPAVRTGGTGGEVYVGTTSTSWQLVDTTLRAGEGNSIILEANTTGVSGYAEFDDVSVTEVNGLIDADMEATGTTAWTGVNSAIVAKVTQTPQEGLQAIRVTRNGVTNAFIKPETDTLIASSSYRLTGYTRSDGNALSTISQGTGSSQTNIWQGTVSTSWQPFDITFTADGGELRFITQSATDPEYVEWDNLQLQKIDGTIDLSGNDLHAIFGDGSDLTTFPTKLKKPAYYFDGTNDYMEVLDNDALDIGTGDFTFTMWIKTPTSWWSDAVYRPLFDKSAGTAWGNVSDADGYGLAVGNDGRLVGVYDGIANSTTLNTPAATLALDTWYHVALVYETGVGGKIYVNSIQQGSTSTVSGDNSNTRNMTIGDTGGGIRKYNGVITDIKIFGSAFHARQIRNLFLEQLSRFK